MKFQIYSRKGGNIIGNVYYIAKSNSFWIKDFNEFKEGLKGFIGGDHGSEVSYQYSEHKRKSKKALIDLCSGDFGTHLYHKDDEDISLNLLEYVKSFILEGEECVIHEVVYEHASDMSITKYIVTSDKVEEFTILED